MKREKTLAYRMAEDFEALRKHLSIPKKKFLTALTRMRKSKPLWGCMSCPMLELLEHIPSSAPPGFGNYTHWYNQLRIKLGHDFSTISNRDLPEAEEGSRMWKILLRSADRKRALTFSIKRWERIYIK